VGRPVLTTETRAASFCSIRPTPTSCSARKRRIQPKRLTIEAEAVLDGGVGGRRRRRERQGEGLQGGAHDTH